jgi:uncharacterized membrane protein (UPF0127 family)
LRSSLRASSLINRLQSTRFHGHPVLDRHRRLSRRLRLLSKQRTEMKRFFSAWFRRRRKRDTSATIVVWNQTRKSILADAADVADSSPKRRKGLLAREALYSGEGLWIVPCGAIHSFGMKFPIDVVYLDRKKRVRKVRTEMVPWRLSMCLLAHSVLELPSGSIARTHTQSGDQLEFRDTSDGLTQTHARARTGVHQ